MNVLVACVGNVFLRDDGFGPEVARALAGVSLPDGVQVKDYGIRGMHLAFDLLEGCRGLVLVDALPRGGNPGDIVVLEVGPEDVSTGAFDAHGMTPTDVLVGLGRLGGNLPRTFVIGCEPADVGEGMGLSPAVAAAVPRAVDVLQSLLQGELAKEAQGCTS